MVKKLLFIFSVLPSLALGFDVSVNGFGNFIYGQHDHNVEDSNKGYLTYDGVERNGKIYDSSAGISFISNLDNKWSAKIQLLGDFNSASKNHDTKLDIYQLSYDYNSNMKLRLGRIRTTTWMFSEVIQVGALYPWMNTPVEVYGKNPMKGFMGAMSSFGADVTKSTQLWLDVYGGTESGRIAGNDGSEVDISARDMFGFNLTWGNEFFTLRASQLKAFLEGEITLAKTIAFDHDSNAGTPDIDVKMRIPSDFSLKNVTFQSFGAKYDKANILLLAEYASVKSDSDFYKKAIGKYITLGYYFSDRKYLLHVTHSQDDEREANAYPSLEKSMAIGLNYQLNASLVLKSEYKKVSVQEENYVGTAAAVYQDAQNRSQNMNLYPDRDINVFSLGLAAVF